MTPEKIRSARALLGWRQVDLARHSGLSGITIKNIEAGRTNPRATTMNAIQKAFEDAGVKFLENGVTWTGA